jgi:hypothetical protein
MTTLKTRLVQGALAAALAVGALGVTATTASADVACNRYGECWHVRDHYTNYPVGLGITFHEEGWRGDNTRHWRWRHDRDDDHGYYSRGVWHPF